MPKPDEDEHLWFEYKESLADSEETRDRINLAREILKSKDALKEHAEDGETIEDVKSKIKLLIDKHKKNLGKYRKRMHELDERLRKRHKIDVNTALVCEAIANHDETEDETNRAVVNAKLEKLRPCKKNRNGAIVTVPLGASGYLGTTEDDSLMQVDVLDEEAIPLENDIDPDELNFYSSANDNKDGIEDLDVEPTRTVRSGTLNIDAFRFSPIFANQLKPHQKEAAELMFNTVGVKGHGFLLAHAPGLGKSLTTIALIEGLSTAQQNFRVIIACPLTLTDSWYAELCKWDDYISFNYNAPIKADKSISFNLWARNGGVAIMGHDRFRIFQKSSSVEMCDMLVVDEAHNLKNPKKRFYKAVNSHSCKKLLLTGTPLQNHLMEYHAMMNIIKVDEKLRDPKQFKLEYANIIERGALANASKDDLTQARTKIKLLSLLTEERIHRRSSAILKHTLPSLHDYKLSFNVDGIDQITGNVCALTQSTATLAMQEKIRLADLLITAVEETYPHDAILIFSKRKDILKALAQHKDGFYMDGETEDRYPLVDRFQNGERSIFCMTTKVGGVGLNMYAANRIIILDPSWNPVDDKQAAQRAYRFGQTKEVFIYRFIVANSVEEKAYRMAVHKNLAACRIVDDKDVERHFTLSQLQTLDDFDEKILKTTKDKALNKVLPHFQSCSSHQVLYADCEWERLTEEEEADACNQRNIIFLQRNTRTIGNEDVEISTKEDIYLPDTLTLVSPMTLCLKQITPCGHFLHGVQPSSRDIDKYEFQVLHNNNIASFEHPLNFVTRQEWKLEFNQIFSNNKYVVTSKQSYMIRCKFCIGVNSSPWSDWSAPIMI